MLHELPNGSHIELAEVNAILVHEPFPPFSTTSSVAIGWSNVHTISVRFDTHGAALDYARTLAGLVNEAKGKKARHLSLEEQQVMAQAALRSAKLVARGDDTC